jgi:tripartite-type tricarboxylate transporter receptor subunit TctC
MKRFLLLAMVALLSSLACAQDYPNRPIKIIIPFPPGGPTDLLGRDIAHKLAEAWGQPVIRRTSRALQAIWRGSRGEVTCRRLHAGRRARRQYLGQPDTFPKLPYKQSDLAPITMLATVENVLVVNPNVPAKNMAELVALAKAKPGSITFASPGAGAQAHLLGEMLSVEAGVQLVHVPYKGIGPALNDLLGGQVSMMFPQTSSALQYIQAGKLRAIGVTSLKRSQVLPETPTMAEQGYLKIDAKSWYALMAPAGVPKEIIKKLSQECSRILRLPEMKEAPRRTGRECRGWNTPKSLLR